MISMQFSFFKDCALSPGKMKIWAGKKSEKQTKSRLIFRYQALRSPLNQDVLPYFTGQVPGGRHPVFGSERGGEVTRIAESHRLGNICNSARFPLQKLSGSLESEILDEVGGSLSCNQSEPTVQLATAHFHLLRQLGTPKLSSPMFFSMSWAAFFKKISSSEATGTSTGSRSTFLLYLFRRPRLD